MPDSASSGAKRGRATVKRMLTPGAAVPNPRLNLDRPNPEDRNLAAHERLLDAVLCLMVEAGAEALADGFKPSDVAKRAGKSRASYYRTEGFPASEAENDESRLAVLEAAIDRALSMDAAEVTRRFEAVPKDIEEGRVPFDPVESIRVSSLANFQTVQNALLSTRLYAAALASSSVNIEASLRRHYDVLTESLVTAYRQAIHYWSREVRPPFGLRDFVVTMLALSDGLILRYCADESIDAETYAHLLASVGAALLVPAV